MSPDAAVAGSAEASNTIASNAQNAVDHLGSVCTAKAILTNPQGVSLRDLRYLHPQHAPSKKCLTTHQLPQDGVVSAYTPTWGTRRSIAPQESYAATAAIGGMYSFCELTSAPRCGTNSCIVKTMNWQTPVSTVMARVEVELTSILKGG